MRLIRPQTTACDRAREAISLALDDELHGLERSRLESHLRGCASCRAYEAEAGAVTRTLRAAELEPAPFAVVMPRKRYVRTHVAAVAAGIAAVAVVAATSVQGVLSRTPHGATSVNLVVDSRHDPTPVRDVHVAATARRHYTAF